MEKIKIEVAWRNKIFSATFGDNVLGKIAFTASSWLELQKEIRKTIYIQVEHLVKDGKDIPQWLINGDYELEYSYANVAALIRSLEPYTSLAALSRETGINQHQLSHYANGMKNPRPQQMQRIVDGIHSIGSHLMSVV